jgi:hypothetical protein
VTKSKFLLLEHHAKIDDALRNEQRRRVPDLFRMQQLKKLKLAVKDRLHRLSPRKAGADPCFAQPARHR